MHVCRRRPTSAASGSTARSSDCRTSSRSTTSPSFDADGSRIYLHRGDEAGWRPGSILYFLVDDIHAAQESLGSRDVRFTGAPQVIYTDDETGVEEWMTFFEDSEGNTLALMSRAQPA